MLLLSYREIVKSYRDLDVLKGVNLDINEGERIGIVGKNGAGKTTFANIISGGLQPDGGNVINSRSDIKVGYLLQSTEYTVNTLGKIVNKNENTGVTGELSEAAGRLGLDNIRDWESERFSGLSGGEKTKLALAGIMTERPELLLLDEPTNHLDFQGVDWLSSELLKYCGTIIIISHDRYFLDSVVKRIVEIDEGKVRSFSGNYTFYRDEKAREYKNRLHQYYEHEKRKEKIEGEIRKVRIWSAKAHREAGKAGTASENKQMGLKQFQRAKAKKLDKRIKAKIKRLEKIEINGVEKPHEEIKLNFIFDDTVKHGRRILEAKEIAKCFGERLLFEKSSFYIQRGDRIGLIGPNGCGKTTLIRIITGEESLDEGEIWISPSAGITYISQDVSDLSPEETSMNILKVIEGCDDYKVRSILASLEIYEDMLNKPVRELSLGERTRIKITYAILESKDFLILDEPTNHLDLYSREQLENALLKFKGTILLISHDRYMLEKVCSRLLVFEKSRIIKFDRCFAEYMRRDEKKLKESMHEIRRNKDNKLILENKIAALINLLSNMSKDDPQFEDLDMEYRLLIEKRKEL